MVPVSYAVLFRWIFIMFQRNSFYRNVSSAHIFSIICSLWSYADSIAILLVVGPAASTFDLVDLSPVSLYVPSTL